MQLPQKKTSYADQRAMFRRVLLSATLLLPAGLTSAEESNKSSGGSVEASSAKPSTALSLPSFPAASVAVTNSASSSAAGVPGPGVPAASAKSATTTNFTLPTLPTSPPANLAAPPSSGSRAVGGTVNTAPLKADHAGVPNGKPASPKLDISDKKLALPATDSRPVDALSSATKSPEISIVLPPEPKSSATAIQGNAQPAHIAETKKGANASSSAPALKVADSAISNPKLTKNLSNPEANVRQDAVKDDESNEGVMIRFGVKPRGEAERVVRGIPGAKKEPLPTTSGNNSSFRLSDKTNITIAPKTEPKTTEAASQATVTKTDASPAVSNGPKLPAGSEVLNASRPAQAISANANALSATKNSVQGSSKSNVPPSNSATTSTPASNAVPQGTVVASPTVGSVPQPKSDAREAVIFRPKAMIVEVAKDSPTVLEAKPTGMLVESPEPSRGTALTSRTKAAISSEGSITMAVEPELELDSVKDAKLSGGVSAAEKLSMSDSTSTALSELVGTSPQNQTSTTGPKLEMSAATIVSSQPPKAIVTPTASPDRKANGKQLTMGEATIALAEPISTEVEKVTSSKPPVALAKSEPLPPADRTIKVGTAEFSTIRLGEHQVEKCEVVDPNICRAVVTTDGEVAFLPGKVGVTRATLWLKQKSGESKVETAEITVGEALATGSNASGDLERLNATLKDLCPGCDLYVVAGDRCIEICGEVDSEQKAKVVLQLVRKLCLVPVKDKVSVR